MRDIRVWMNHCEIHKLVQENIKLLAEKELSNEVIAYAKLLEHIKSLSKLMMRAIKE